MRGEGLGFRVVQALVSKDSLSGWFGANKRI